MGWQTNISWVANPSGGKLLEHVNSISEIGPETGWSIGAS